MSLLELFLDLEYMGVAFKITRNPVKVILEQLNETPSNYAHCDTKIACCNNDTTLWLKYTLIVENKYWVPLCI